MTGSMTSQDVIETWGTTHVKMKRIPHKEGAEEGEARQSARSMTTQGYKTMGERLYKRKKKG